MFSEPNGYCIFNNAAIAVRHALDILGLDRILLVDWDVHHGQGSQYAFYDDPRYVSWSSAAYNSYSFAIFFYFIMETYSQYIQQQQLLSCCCCMYCDYDTIINNKYMDYQRDGRLS